jgi:hypothetical protein
MRNRTGVLILTIGLAVLAVAAVVDQVSEEIDQ